MPPIPPLFTVSVEPNGTITCTQPSQKIYLLSFDLPPDNRHTPEFCAAFLLTLDIIEYRYPRGIVITTSAISKFYSNGLDYESAIKSKDFFSNSLYPLWRRILTWVASLFLSVLKEQTAWLTFRSFTTIAIQCPPSLYSMATPLLLVS